MFDVLLFQRYEKPNWGSLMQDLSRELQHYCNRYWHLVCFNFAILWEWLDLEISLGWPFTCAIYYIGNWTNKKREKKPYLNLFFFICLYSFNRADRHVSTIYLKQNFIVPFSLPHIFNQKLQLYSYSEWIDECERVNNLEDDGTLEGRADA